MTNFFSLNDLGLSSSSAQILQTWLDQMQEAYPGYTPSAANLEYVQAQIFASLAADLASLCSNGATELFRVYASTLVNLPYQQGVAAQAVVTIAANASASTVATLSQTLSTGGPILTIPVAALPYGIAAGSFVITDPTLAHTQTYTTSGASAGATQVPISSATPNFAYPPGSTFTGTQAFDLPPQTQFNLDSFGFVNLADLTLNAGTSVNVTLTAVQSGTAYNGAGQGGIIQTVQQLPWINTVTLVTPGANGQDPEDDAHYLDRVTTELQLQAPRPITANDYGLMALNFNPFPGTDQQEVGRATAIDGYDPGTHTFTATTTNTSATLTVVSSFTGVSPGSVLSGAGIQANTTVLSINTGANTLLMSLPATAGASGVTITSTGSYNNPREVAVAVTDDNGYALNTDTLYGYPNGTSSSIVTTTPNSNSGWGIAGWLQSLRETGFIVNLINPTYNPIYVTVSVKASTGWDATSVASNVQAALLGFLAPGGWGLPTLSSTTWQNTTVIYTSVLADVIQRASGVAYILDGTLKLGLSASPSNTLDLTLLGPIALPTSNTTTIPLGSITVS